MIQPPHSRKDQEKERRRQAPHGDDAHGELDESDVGVRLSSNVGGLAHHLVLHPMSCLMALPAGRRAVTHASTRPATAALAAARHPPRVQPPRVRRRPRRETRKRKANLVTSAMHWWHTDPLWSSRGCHAKAASSSTVVPAGMSFLASTRVPLFGR